MAKDTLTAKFSIEADFETIQAIRRRLADPDSRAEVVSLLSDTLRIYLAGQVTGEHAIEAHLKASQERATRAGPRSPIPMVKGGELSWYDPYADRVNVVGQVDSADWFAWLALERSTSFRYTSRRGATFTAMRRKGGVWYAHRRVRGKLRRAYLGVSDSVTGAKLEQVSISLSSDTES